jgi:iron-chelate-transporting ATPase
MNAFSPTQAEVLSAPLFELDEVAFTVASRKLLESLTMTLPVGRMIGLIGHNGSGKSTLVKILARQQPASQGVMRFRGRALPQWGDREFARKLAGEGARGARPLSLARGAWPL